MFLLQDEHRQRLDSRLHVHARMPGPGEHLSAVRGVALPGRVLGLLAPALGQELLQLRNGGTQKSEAGRGLRQFPSTPIFAHPSSDVP